jgi:hypothetical protein
MKKLIFIIAFIATISSAKSQCGYYFNNYDPGCYAQIEYFNNDDYTTHYITRYNQGGSLTVFGDTLILGGDTMLNSDIPKFKLIPSIGRDTISTTFGIYSYNISHGQAFTPDHVFLQARSADAAAECWVSAITSTYFTVTFINTPPTDTNNVIFDWTAYK